MWKAMTLALVLPLMACQSVENTFYAAGDMHISGGESLARTDQSRGGQTTSTLNPDVSPNVDANVNAEGNDVSGIPGLGL